MKNQVQSDEIITLAAPYAVNSGAGALIGSLFGVAGKTLANGETGAFATRGVFDLAKVGSQAWTVGAKIYWDNTNKRPCVLLTILRGLQTISRGGRSRSRVGIHLLSARDTR